jgi:hypothetical protein
MKGAAIFSPRLSLQREPRSSPSWGRMIPPPEAEDSELPNVGVIGYVIEVADHYPPALQRFVAMAVPKNKRTIRLL